jgi:6-pyruvoyltetrahydropterin/6-carboxytetrahydropterin synthase
MARVLLTKRIEFAAAHRYHNEAWDEARNRTVFGACSNEPGHGHNYMLEVTVAGEVDEQTGMVVNLYDLKQILKEVLEEFDHKHLNLDTPYFKEVIPTSENIAAVLWRILATHPEIGTLEKIRLYEDDDLYADITATGGKASLTRRYHFSAAHRLYTDRLSVQETRRLFGEDSHPHGHDGHNYTLQVTVGGLIDAETGMVTDIPMLDRVVQEQVVKRFDHKDLSQDPALVLLAPTGENLVRLIWSLLVKAIPTVRLERVGLWESRDAYFEYVG